MPNHWHLVLRPDHPRQLSSFMHRLKTTHAVGFRPRTGTRGHGSVCGGRFRSFPRSLSESSRDGARVAATRGARAMAQSCERSERDSMRSANWDEVPAVPRR
ncbi:MAG: hypothetical protein FJ292_06700 [Planctomycetes bacterium]|nr:hypothetical protein [Planctomycetota bacterium]